MTAKLRTVVLVDDSDADNYFHRMVIERSGLVDEVLAFEQADKALDHLESCAPDGPWPELILLDINMPAMNGWEFLDAYEKLDGATSVVIVMLTTSLNPDDSERAKSIGLVGDFRIKPLDAAGLAEIIESHFGDRG